MIRNIEVRGGYMSGGSKDDDKDGKNSESSGTFVVRARADKSGRQCIEVVPEDQLGAFFRRDWEMCGMPVIKLRVTNEQPTIVVVD